MSRLVQAAKHYGLPKKRYTFSMHIHRVVLLSEKRKLFVRVLWTGRKSSKKKLSKDLSKRHHSKWCEGVELYNVDESISHEATIYFSSDTNQVQVKWTKITIQIRDRIDGADRIFAKFELDLSKYIDASNPHRIYYQRLNYEKSHKRAQVTFTIKSMENSDGALSDYTDNDDEEEVSQSNYTEDDYDSVASETTLNTIQNALTSKFDKFDRNINGLNGMSTKPMSLKKRHSAPNAMTAAKAHQTSNAIHSDISGQKLKVRHFRNASAITADTVSALSMRRNIRLDGMSVFRKDFQKDISPTPSSTVPSRESRESNETTITITRRNAPCATVLCAPSPSCTTSTNLQISHLDDDDSKMGTDAFVQSLPILANHNDSIQNTQNTPNMMVAPSTPSFSAGSSSHSEDLVAELRRKVRMFQDKGKKYKFKYVKLQKKVLV